jgi:hypothetical protein
MAEIGQSLERPRPALQLADLTTISPRDAAILVDGFTFTIGAEAGIAGIDRNQRGAPGVEAGAVKPDGRIGRRDWKAMLRGT